MRTQQDLADATFPRIAAELGFRLWKPGDPVPLRGLRILIGVATYSSSDMEFLDEVVSVLRRTGSDRNPIDVFNVQEVAGPAHFSAYIPGLQEVYQTPVVGVWINGHLVESATGSDGRQLVFEALVPRAKSTSPKQISSGERTLEDAPGILANLFISCAWCHGTDETASWLDAALQEALTRAFSNESVVPLVAQVLPAGHPVYGGLARAANVGSYLQDPKREREPESDDQLRVEMWIIRSQDVSTLPRPWEQPILPTVPARKYRAWNYSLTLRTPLPNPLVQDLRYHQCAYKLAPSFSNGLPEERRLVGRHIESAIRHLILLDEDI